MTLRLGRHSFADDRRLMMAIVNRTPDSFYDKGATWSEDKAIDRVAQVVDEGAEIVDIGGIKAAPGAEIDVEEEMRRTVGSSSGYARPPRRGDQRRHLARSGRPGGLRGRGRRAQRRLGRCRPGPGRRGRGVRRRHRLHAHRGSDPADPPAPDRVRRRGGQRGRRHHGVRRASAGRRRERARAS